MLEIEDGAQWLAFRLDSMDYCVLSSYIESIAIPEKIEIVPDSPSTLAGVMVHKGDVISVMNMREVFGRMNLDKYKEEFGVMRDAHITWVEDLQDYVRNGGQFTKAVDPHKCKCGIWYDSFHTDNDRLNQLLLKISEPHAQIHRCGAEIIELRGKDGNHDEQIEKKLTEANCICHEDVVPLLNQLIEIYQEANRGVVLIVNDGANRTGLLVDGVRRLIPCAETKVGRLNGMIQSNYLQRVITLDEQVLLEINVEKIIRAGNSDYREENCKMEA